MFKQASVFVIALSLTVSAALASPPQKSEVSSDEVQVRAVSVDDQIGVSEKDLVDVTQANASFKTLNQALQAAGLVDTLRTGGPFTIFAPTDEAFKELPPGILEGLLKPENKEQLIKVLTYHVVPQRVGLADVTQLQTTSTVEGQSLRFDVSRPNQVRVNNATLIQTDIPARNGVIHAIDHVLIPADTSNHMSD